MLSNLFGYVVGTWDTLFLKLHVYFWNSLYDYATYMCLENSPGRNSNGVDFLSQPFGAPEEFTVPYVAEFLDTSNKKLLRFTPNHKPKRS